MATKIKMEHVRSYIDPQIGNPAKSTGNFIEWNVDMNVTISNVKKSKMFQRSRGIVVFLLVIVFAVILSHLRKEVRALQVQMQSVNVNLLILMSKYDRLNRSFNRAWSQRPDKFLEQRNMHDVKRILDGAASASKVIQVFDEIRNASNGNSYTYNSVAPYLNSTRNSEDEFSSNNNIRGTNKGNYITIPKTSTELENKINNFGNKDETNLRIERAILTVEKQNSTNRHSDLNSDDVTDNSNIKDDYDDDESDIWNEPRTGRARRDEGRGKKRGKNKRRPKRSRRRLGPLVATFVGAIPEQHITDTVYIGPWVKSVKSNTQYSLNKFHLVEDKKSIEVTTTGLYMISAQIFYFGEPTNYSYWILLSSEGKSTTQKLVKCSTASSTTATEVSCYTSVITPLQRGDRVHIQQQEKNRLINMREGHSYVQLVLLSNNTRRKRLR